MSGCHNDRSGTDGRVEVVFGCHSDRRQTGEGSSCLVVIVTGDRRESGGRVWLSW